MKKKYLFVLLILLIVLLYIFFHLNFLKKKNNQNSKVNDTKKIENLEEEPFGSNIMSNISYSSVDLRGNKYIISAEKAETDFQNRNILYLTNVKAEINLVNSEKIQITSNYGKYN